MTVELGDTDMHLAMRNKVAGLKTWVGFVPYLATAESFQLVSKLRGAWEECQTGDPICGPASDECMAAIVKNTLLRYMVQHASPLMRPVVIGIIMACRTMGRYGMWGGRDRGVFWPEPDQNLRCASWPSALLKWAGTSLYLGKSSADHAPYKHNSFLALQRAMFFNTGNCLPDWRCSSISDDSGLLDSRRRGWEYLFGSGLVVKPSPSAWAKAFAPLEMFMPSGVGLATTTDPLTVLRNKNGTRRKVKAVPAETFALVQSQGPHLAHLAYCILHLDEFQRDVTNTTVALRDERERYAVWASGNVPDIMSTMRNWDTSVAYAFDTHRHTGGDIYTQRNPVRYLAQHIGLCDNDMFPVPPWSQDDGNEYGMPISSTFGLPSVFANYVL